MITSTRSANHNRCVFFCFRDMKPKSYSSKVRQNNTVERLCYPIFLIVSENGPADHLRPQIDFLLIFISLNRNPIGPASRQFYDVGVLVVLVLDRAMNPFCFVTILLLAIVFQCNWHCLKIFARRKRWKPRLNCLGYMALVELPRPRSPSNFAQVLQSGLRRQEYAAMVSMPW